MGMKMYDSYKNVMMDISSLKRKGDDIVMKGTLMGTMPSTIYVKPEEVWNAIKMLSWPIISYLPMMVIKGWKLSKRSK
ncbi:MAG: hypothetical protein KKC46_16130 [Proteobacteria bacterium]|nr:hypothetical protein [Pseudomonadota bacterium]